MKLIPKGQAGFSLISVIVSSLILSICFVFISQMLLHTQSIGTNLERFTQFASVRETIMRGLNDQCAITNSVLDEENDFLKCLYEGDCKAANGAEPQTLTLRGSANELIYSPLQNENRLMTANGSTCANGDIGCVHGFDLKATIKCADGANCAAPYLVISGQLYRLPQAAPAEGRPPEDEEPAADTEDRINYGLHRLEKQMPFNRPYRNCQDVVARGQAENPPRTMASGMYLMDPDGQGEICPFEVYCDLAPTSDGGAWALVANQSLVSDVLVEKDPPLYKGMTGRLPDKNIQALLKASDPTLPNNVRVKIDSRINSNHTMGFHIPSHGATGEYTSTQGYCKNVPPTRMPTSFLPKSTGYKFAVQDPLVGIGYDGRFYCTACDTNHMNAVCNDIVAGGCCSAENPVEGSVWVK